MQIPVASLGMTIRGSESRAPLQIGFHCGSCLSILNEEFSAADESCRTLQINLILPADGLRASGRNHRHRRSDATARNRGYRRGARSRTRRLRLSDAAFKQPDLDFIRTAHHYILHIRALRKL